MLDFNHPDLPTVLLIDDDLVSREVMATMLTLSGYPVHTAEEGNAALTMMASDDCVPGVILMDAQMPGLSGTALISELRSRSKARIYVISGSAADELAGAADGFLLKPFPPEALTQLIEAQTSKPQPDSSLDPDEVIVKPETLKQLLEMMPKAQVQQIFEAILADLDKRTTALEAAIADGDWPEARRIGHSIKGGAAMAGAMQVSRLGQLIESGALEPKSPAVNQVNNSAGIIQDLRNAALNLQRILDAEFKA